jgi:hypothetical protein
MVLNILLMSMWLMSNLFLFDYFFSHYVTSKYFLIFL